MHIFLISAKLVGEHKVNPVGRRFENQRARGSLGLSRTTLALDGQKSRHFLNMALESEFGTCVCVGVEICWDYVNMLERKRKRSVWFNILKHCGGNCGSVWWVVCKTRRRY